MARRGFYPPYKSAAADSAGFAWFMGRAFGALPAKGDVFAAASAFLRGRRFVALAARCGVDCAPPIVALVVLVSLRFFAGSSRHVVDVKDVPMGAGRPCEAIQGFDMNVCA